MDTRVAVSKFSGWQSDGRVSVSKILTFGLHRDITTSLTQAAPRDKVSSTDRATDTSFNGPRWNFASTPVRQACEPIQAKLEIGAVDDPLEREADAIAEHVMRMTDSNLSPVQEIPTKIRRKCAACEEEEQHHKIARKASPTGSVPKEITAPPIVHDVLREPGYPLDVQTRSFFEPRFGYDFSSVRVHNATKAAESAQAIGAIAYTVGHDIVFNQNVYRPDSNSADRLMAHELAHTIQQGSAQSRGGHAIDVPRNVPRVYANVEPVSHSLVSGVGSNALLQREAGAAAAPTVYICAKDLETSPIGRHAFFRVGGPGKGNPTFELEPEDRRAMQSIDGELRHSGCWQGIPQQNAKEDFDYEGSDDCEATSISLSCLEREAAAYPIGKYCTFGPNSNTFVGHIARNCGMTNVDPPGWTPGIDDKPPQSGTFAPSPGNTAFGCEEETGCLVVATEIAPASTEEDVS